MWSSYCGAKIASCRRSESQENAAWTTICEEFNSHMESKQNLVEKYRSCDVYWNQ